MTRYPITPPRVPIYTRRRFLAPPPKDAWFVRLTAWACLFAVLQVGVIVGYWIWRAECAAVRWWWS